MRASGHRLSFMNIVQLLVVLFVAVACAGASGDDDDDAGIEEPTTRAAAMATSASDTAAGEAEDEPSVGSGNVEDADEGRDVAAQQVDWNRLIIRTARLNLTVTDVGQAVTWVRDTASSKGGYVFSSNSHLQEDSQFAEVTIQVPVATFDDTMNALRNGELVEKVEREESTSQDVSSEFVDNESRVATLRETHARFLELLSQANTVDEILKLEYELQSVREQIETIEGRQQYLEQATSFSTITVALAPVGIAAPAESAPATEPAFSLRGIAERSWEHARGAIEGLLVVTITASIFAVVFVPLALVAWVAIRFTRRRLRGLTWGA